MTFLNSITKYKYVQINLKLQPSFTIKAISPTKLQSAISLLNAGISEHKIASNVSISIGTILNIHSKHFPTLIKLSGNYPSKPFPANKRHAAYILTSQEAKTIVDCPNCLRNITNNLV